MDEQSCKVIVRKLVYAGVAASLTIGFLGLVLYFVLF